MSRTPAAAAAGLKLRPATNADRQQVESLVFGVLQEYGLAPAPASTDKDLADLEFHYLSRGGIFDVMEDASGQIIGSVGLYPIDTHCVELRKMYLKREVRRKGLGKKLLEHALKCARDKGYKRVTLETPGALKEAIRLYERFGFRPFAAQHLATRCDGAFVLDLDPEN
jgi:putative acetyltransferase